MAVGDAPRWPGGDIPLGLRPIEEMDDDEDVAAEKFLAMFTSCSDAVH
jgi:hypothetical protein